MTHVADLERTAVRLAREAGERIAAALSSELVVEFKATRSGFAPNSNPVSNVDRAVESFIRQELERTFPDHGIIGEEKAGQARAGAEFTWVIDPVDGTTNFINGLPLFASSIGVLRNGAPVAGAIWCATTPALRPAVYHASRGGVLCLDGEPVERRQSAEWRGVAGLPRHMRALGAYWDVRVIGSATLELAFVAAGLLRLSYLSRPGLWDVAAGAALAQAAGCAVFVEQNGDWSPLTRFEPLDAWSRPILAGDPDAVDLAIKHSKDINP